MDIQRVISQLAVLFLLIAAGWVTGKTKILTEDGSKCLSKLVLYVTTPCTILSSVFGEDMGVTAAETGLFILASAAAFLIYFVVAVPSARLLSPNKENRGLMGFMISFGNVTFMGLPVAIAVFGPASAYYVALFNIPFMALVFSVGIIMISGKRGKMDLRLLVTPSLIAALLAVPIALTGYRAPSIPADAIRIAGNLTTPGSMLVIGSTLSRVKIRDVFSKWRLYPIALLKLTVIPVIAWAVFRPLIASDLLLGVLVILSGMPTAAMAAMFAIEYGADERFASSGIFLATLLSGATIPLVVYFLL